MIKLTVFAFLVLVPGAYCATSANSCRIAGTVAGAVLGSNNGATLETSCADTFNFCKNNRKRTTSSRTGGSILASLSAFNGINRKRRSAGQVTEGVQKVACGEVATEAMIAEAVRSKDPSERSKQIAKLVCKPISYDFMVSSCNEAVKAAKVPNGSDLSKVDGCETFQYIDNLAKPCKPHAA